MVPKAAAVHTGFMPIDSGAAAGFDEIVLPHLEAGRRLARWLLGNPDDAEDAVQEASLRAFRYFATFTGGNGRAWFLRIVRNTCSGRRSRPETIDQFDEECHSQLPTSSTPETLLLQTDDATLVGRAMCHLPDRAKRLLTLRELEGLSYRELADAMDMPMGTVMSGLSRARDAFREALVKEQGSTPRTHQCHMFDLGNLTAAQAGRSTTP